MFSGIIKMDVMAEQQYWIVLDRTGVPNKLDNELNFCEELQLLGE